jgi:hypothetical protein
MQASRRRVLRNSAVLAGGVVLMVAGAIGASTALASPTSAIATAAPTAPFTAFTADGHGWGIVGSRDLTNVVAYATGERMQFEGQPANLRADLWPPTGSVWEAGTTYETLHSADATHARFQFGASTSCSGTPTGSLTVHEVVRTEGEITAFAASYAYICDPTRIGYGELRFNSSIGYKIAHIEQDRLEFGDIFIGNTSAPMTVTYTGRGSEPTTFGAATITGAEAGSFTITDDGCDGVVLGYGETCSVSVVAHPTTLGQKPAQLNLPEDEAGGFKRILLYTTGVPQPQNLGKYYGLEPYRLLDTRVGRGAPQAKLGPGGQLDLQVLWLGGVPDQGVSAVVLNVTVTNPTQAGYLTVWPTGVARPTASSLNFTAGWTGANMVTVGVGDGGKVSIFNASGSVDVIADVVGYYNSTDYMLMAKGPASYYDPIVPARLFDSRSDLGIRVPGGYAVDVPFTFGPAVDPTVKAIAVNVTAVDPVAAGYFTTWAGLGQLPVASTLNYARGAVVPNMAIVPVCTSCVTGGYPSIGVFTNVSSHMLVDILGVFHNGATGEGLRFEPVTPQRIADSRSGQGLPAALGQGVTGTVTVPGSLADESTYGVATNVTAVSPTRHGYVSVWPADLPGVGQPLVSNLNTAPGQTLPNSVYTLIGPESGFHVYNHAGSTDIVIDVVGRFYLGSDRGLPAVAARGAGFTVGAPATWTGPGAGMKAEVFRPAA